MFLGFWLLVAAIRVSGNGKKLVKGKFVKGQQNGGKLCNFCNKTSHRVDTCFKKHGYPPHFKKGYAVNHVSSDDYENEELPNEESQQTTNFFLIKDQFEGLMAMLKQSVSACLNPYLIHKSRETLL